VPKAWALLAAAVAFPAAAAGPFDVHYRNGTLSVRIERVPLDDVLAAVARETGMTIEGEPLDRRDVSERFDTLPLDQALRRLLERQNFVLRYDADGTPARLELLGGPMAPRKPAPRQDMDVLRALLAAPSVTVPEPAATALGGTRLSLARALDGLRHDNPVVRTQVAELFARSLESDASLLAAVNEMDIERLAQFVRNQARQYAADVAAKLYHAARDPRLRARLSRVIATLQRTMG
jgi:hypothetical protein